MPPKLNIPVETVSPPYLIITSHFSYRFYTLNQKVILKSPESH